MSPSRLDWTSVPDERSESETKEREMRTWEREMRTWTATIEVEQRGQRTTIEASNSEWDLLRDQINVAVNEAYLLGVLTEPGTRVEVVLFKTTQARGTERDRSFVPFLDRRGRLRYDGPYA